MADRRVGARSAGSPAGERSGRSYAGGRGGARSTEQRGGDRRGGRPVAAEAPSSLARVPIRDAAVGRMTEPPLPDDVDVRQLDRDVRADLRSLSIGTADTVAKHLVVAGSVVDDDPALALKHARFARSIAARVGAVREAVGVTAYHAGEWAEALAELRAARRITGDPRWIAVMADCERALDRPQRAVKVLEDPDLARVDAATRAEVLIVAAGARRDMGQDEAALLLLSTGNIDRSRPQPGVGRLWYAYADLLDHMGRTEEARSWFAAVARLDDDETDADERAGWDG